MNIKLSKYSQKGYSTYEVDDQVTCELNGASVEVRQSPDGTHMIVVIQGNVSMEPRAAGIWLVVKDSRGTKGKET